MNVEIGTAAAQIPEKEYINGIFVAVFLLGRTNHASSSSSSFAIICNILSPADGHLGSPAIDVRPCPPQVCI
jgi:hypothetical protein